MPGKSADRLCAITSSSITNCFSSPGDSTGMKRGRLGGTFTRAKCVIVPSGVDSSISTPSESDRFEMYGKG